MLLKDVRLPLLLGYAGLGLALFLSWHSLPATRALWDVADLNVFLALNGSLVWGETWRSWWALSNSRYFDVVPGSLILLLYFTWMFQQGGRYLRQRFRIGMFMAVFTVLWSQLFIKGLLGAERDSPSVVHPDLYVTVGGIFPEWMGVKTFSNHSFPGDHAAVMLLVGLIILHICGWRRGVLAMLVFVVFSLPRLYGGGHWFTDVVVGGGLAGLTGAALFLGTPLRRWAGAEPPPVESLPSDKDQVRAADTEQGGPEAG